MVGRDPGPHVDRDLDLDVDLDLGLRVRMCGCTCRLPAQGRWATAKRQISSAVQSSPVQEEGRREGGGTACPCDGRAGGAGPVWGPEPHPGRRGSREVAERQPKEWQPTWRASEKHSGGESRRPGCHGPERRATRVRCSVKTGPGPTGGMRTTATGGRPHPRVDLPGPGAKCTKDADKRCHDVTPAPPRLDLTVPSSWHEPPRRILVCSAQLTLGDARGEMGDGIMKMLGFPGGSATSSPVERTALAGMGEESGEAGAVGRIPAGIASIPSIADVVLAWPALPLLPPRTEPPLPRPNRPGPKAAAANRLSSAPPPCHPPTADANHFADASARARRPTGRGMRCEAMPCYATP
ncbi:hypothetical protein JHW43_008261 [Diplocarpon mali]|nr:hypothetical protein JHW43_008261 [Diplocarpon mali]